MTALWTLGAAAAIAAVELDATGLGQFMISRPIIVGPILGNISGVLGTGALLGALFEALSFERLPIGGQLPINGAVAVATGILLVVGPTTMPLELAFPTAWVAGWAHSRLESMVRANRAPFRRASPKRLGSVLAAGLALQVVVTMAVLISFIFLVGPILIRIWPIVPQSLRIGARGGLAAAPWLAIATVLATLRGAK